MLAISHPGCHNSVRRVSLPAAWPPRRPLHTGLMNLPVARTHSHPSPDPDGSSLPRDQRRLAWGSEASLGSQVPAFPSPGNAAFSDAFSTLATTLFPPPEAPVPLIGTAFPLLRLYRKRSAWHPTRSAPRGSPTSRASPSRLHSAVGFLLSLQVSVGGSGRSAVTFHCCAPAAALEELRASGRSRHLNKHTQQSARGAAAEKRTAYLFTRLGHGGHWVTSESGVAGVYQDHSCGWMVAGRFPGRGPASYATIGHCPVGGETL